MDVGTTKRWLLNEGAARVLLFESLHVTLGARRPRAESAIDMKLGFFIALLGVAACGRPNMYADATRDCQSAATLLAPGREPTPEMAPALWRVRACPARAAEILATVLRDSRTTTDTARLEAATWLTQYVHDAQLVSAGIDVATDGRATPEARVAALRTLLWSKAPGHFMPLQAMATGPSCDPRQCYSTYTGHFYGGGPVRGDTIRWPVFGTPMPARYAASIDSAAAVAERTSGTPEIVRRAAAVVRQFPSDRELGGR